MLSYLLKKLFPEDFFTTKEGIPMVGFQREKEILVGCIVANSKMSDSDRERLSAILDVQGPSLFIPMACYHMNFEALFEIYNKMIVDNDVTHPFLLLGSNFREQCLDEQRFCHLKKAVL